MTNTSAVRGTSRDMPPSLMIRKLHHSISNETIRGMLMFSSDLIQTEIVKPFYDEDEGYATVVAHFQTRIGALEAQRRLNGKSDPSGRSNLIVQLQSNDGFETERRNTVHDTCAFSRAETSRSPKNTSGLSSPSASQAKLNGSWRSPSKVSPTIPSPNGIASSARQLEGRSFSVGYMQQSSPPKNAFDERNRASGKHVINGDGPDEETSRLLSDPVAFSRNEATQRSQSDHTAMHAAIDEMRRLSLATNGASPSNGQFNVNYYEAPRTASGALLSPISPTNITNMYSAGHGFQSPRRNGHRQSPPPNPADANNAPCNTLYVGNLPAGASEDELKSIFSKQAGYRRMSLRTKGNGPMCFVEFVDVTYATRALFELHGVLLTNSVKGGIRLSFSKNPLGVRGSQSPNGVQAANGYHQYVNGGVPQASYGNGIASPPPGLSSPPGFTPTRIAPNGYSYTSPQTNGSTNGHSNGYTNGPTSPNGFSQAYSPRDYASSQFTGNEFYRKGYNAFETMTGPQSTGPNAYSQSVHYHVYDQGAEYAQSGNLTANAPFDPAQTNGDSSAKGMFQRRREGQQESRQGFSDRNMGR